ncbi:MAG: helix-turn-helix transcriptional regulator [Alphaproteobacteria bacterium]|nr:helix-turn-helix transcriptional regulator [Alphaproteobacteria bacterium]
MEAKNTISERLAKRLKLTRKSKGLSLEAMAKLSGVSRSMLSQIERGESSPTVATLWSLTNALQVDFAGLLDEGKADTKIKEVLRAQRTPTIDSQGEGCRIRILSPADQVGKTEIYEIEFAKGGALVSEAHSQGCIEHVTVLGGKLRVKVAEEDAELQQGDTIRYAADCKHAIYAVGEKAKALLVVHNP